MKEGSVLRLSVCPLCGKAYGGRPAFSRRDSRRICPDCGAREALESIGVCEEEREEILAILHGRHRMQVCEED